MWKKRKENTNTKNTQSYNTFKMRRFFLLPTENLILMVEPAKNYIEK